MTDKPLALITGAAQGIGYACAEALKEDGFDVILADINADGVTAAGESLGAVAAMACDMGDVAQIEAMFAQIASNHGPLHALVNNAGVAMPGDFLTYELESWQRVIDINLRGVFLATQMAARVMVENEIEAGHGDRLAVIHDSPVTGQVTRFTCTQVREQVGALASVLRGLGVAKGDRVVIYMPMVPQAVFAMLACARLDDAAPRVVISASCGIEPGRVIAYKPLLDEAIALAANKPAHCVILQRETLTCDLTPGRDVDYAEAIGDAIAKGDSTECVPVAAFKCTLEVKRLPKTRSGKVLRSTVQKIADGASFKMPAAIDDPAILDEIPAALAARNLIGEPA